MNKELNKYLLIVFFFFVVFATKAQIIRINVNLFHISNIMPRLVGIEYEKSINYKNSLGVAIEYYYLEPAYSGDGEYSGFRSQFYYRKYFLNNEKYNGLFIAPTISYLHTSVPEKGEPLPGINQINGIQNGIGIGLVTGYNIVFKNNLIFGFSLGTSYYMNYVKKEFSDLSIFRFRTEKIELDFKIHIGWIIK